MNDGINFLDFKPGYYTITKLIEPNVLEVNKTWFIKLKGISDNTSTGELGKWLKQNNVVRIVPYRRNSEARVISEVWLGNTHINRQFACYKKENFIQAFEQWKTHTLPDGPDTEDMINAFYLVEDSLTGKLKESFTTWIKNRGPKTKPSAEPPPLSSPEGEEKKTRMITDFENWRSYHS